MRLVEYTPADFPALLRAAETTSSAASLRHQPFVDHYYVGHPGCRLYLVRDESGKILGTLGIDKMPMRHGDRDLIVGAGSNFLALQKGVGGLLFFHWLRTSPIGFVFGGSADTHHLLGSMKWTYLRGVRTFYLDRQIAFYPGEPAWRKAAKTVWHWMKASPSPAVRLRRINRTGFNGLSVVEESAYCQDLIPAESPFTFRLTPDVAYLDWRYGLRLSFVRYRLFRIVRSSATAGYVILNDQPRSLMVAQADADDAVMLARGILLSVVAATKNDRKPREVSLASSHPAMQAIFTEFGFRASKQNRPFVLGTARGGVDFPVDTSNWLVNLDWADNGLRVPFLA